jgi:epoxyqueuosine reductase QueG
VERLSKDVLDYLECQGTCSAGIATLETLDGGPPSTDLTYVLDNARSAISFAVPLNQNAVLSYLMKKDRISHEMNNLQTNSLASGIALHLANYLIQKGYESVPVAANFVYRGDPQSFDISDGFPDISHRYLAARSGVGHFGLSGNIITKNEGAGVILGAVVTSAHLIPTDPLPEEDTYCDDCGLCMASCSSGLMDDKDKTSVTLGGVEFTYSKRLSYRRCEFVCGGYTGLYPSGKWSTWSPARFNIPEDDEGFDQAVLNAIDAYHRRPAAEGGFYFFSSDDKFYLTCGNCQLICCPDKEERKRRYKMLTESGVVIQNPDGTLEVVSPGSAKERLASMDPELRSVYE